MPVREAAQLTKEMKSQLTALGITYDIQDERKLDDKAAKKKERFQRDIVEFSLPLRCCWLFPKVKMPGMKYSWHDPYGKSLYIILLC